MGKEPINDRWVQHTSLYTVSKLTEETSQEEQHRRTDTPTNLVYLRRFAWYSGQERCADNPGCTCS